MVVVVCCGDEVVMQGGLIGKVFKVKDGENELEVEIVDGVKVCVVQNIIVDVKFKIEFVKF